jgi:hypothetical protein
VWKRFKAQGESKAVDPESQGPSDLHVISCIGGSRVEAARDCIKNRDIARCDISTEELCGATAEVVEDRWCVYWGSGKGKSRVHRHPDS